MPWPEHLTGASTTGGLENASEGIHFQGIQGTTEAEHCVKAHIKEGQEAGQVGEHSIIF